MTDAMSIARSGLDAMRTRVAAAAGNIANSDTDNYQARRVDLATAADDQGVAVSGVRLDSAPGAPLPPSFPTASPSTDSSDAVTVSAQDRSPDQTSNTDPVRETLTLMEASRGFEANAAVIMLNLRVGNLPEARGYFNVLVKKYPTDANVPLVNFYWGEYYYDHGDYNKAAAEYKQLIEKYPESKFVREGAMGLAKTLVRLGQYKEAAQIADYIDKRWPRYYIDFPGILRIDGDIAFRIGDIKKAKDYYLMYYNLEPKVKDLDMTGAKPLQEVL